MRLLQRGHDGEFTLTEDLVGDDVSPYAVLSHRWGPEEVTYRDLVDGTGKRKAGYKKLEFCAEQATRDGLQYFWVDTCCIDKSTSDEVQTSINSMFRWYRDAARCYVYLSDVSITVGQPQPSWEQAFRDSEWFTRGWTLQELVAPASVEFFTKDGHRLGDKRSLEQQIHEITGIALAALRGTALTRFDTEERFKWAATRKTTREEDWAYCLLGIFGIFMPLIYGEGKAHAVRRLKQEISQSEGPARQEDNLEDSPIQQSLELLDSLPEAAFNAANKQHAATCLPETRRDVLGQIRTWADGNGDRRIFWLKGMAGTGKSTIALTVASEYSLSKRLGASFFFSRGGGDLASVRRFAATIAVQLAESSPELRKSIADAAATGSRRIRGLGLYGQWEKLILQPLGQLGKDAFPHSLVIVVDALDECDNNDDVSLLIRCLAAAVTVENVDLRVFVTSRPDLPINLGFDNISIDAHQDFVLHDIEQSIVDQDLTIYYKHQLGQIARTWRLGAAFLSDDAIQNLVQKACILFIYAATVCRFVREGGPLAGERLAHLVYDERLDSGPESELDRMYMVVLKYSLNAQLYPDEMTTMRELFGRFMGAIVVLFDALSLTSLATLLGESKEKIASLLGSFHALIDVPEEDGRLIRVLHPSFREFLLDPQRCTNPMFCIDAKKLHSHLFGCCLRVMADHLRKNICDLQRPGTRVRDIPKSDVNKKVPFAVQYACRYWAYHLERSDVDSRELASIAEFFETQFLFWLETLALTGRLADGIAMVRLIETRLHTSAYAKPLPYAAPGSESLERNAVKGSRGLFRRMKAKLVIKTKPIPRRAQDNPSHDPSLDAVVYDAKRFLLSHSSIIEEAPLQAYCSALVFSPEASIIRRLFMHRLLKWIASAPALSKDWSVHLQTVSHPGMVSSVAFSPDGRLIVSGCFDKTVRLWDAATGAERRVLQGHSNSVTAVAFSPPNGRLIASASDDNTVRIWDAATGTERRVFQGHSDRVRALAFSADGCLIASGSNDRTVQIWDTATSINVKCVLQGHSGYVRAVAFLSDSRLIASVSEDETVRIWDAATGVGQYVLRGHSGWVVAVASSPDNRFIASGSDDKTVRVWDVTTGVERCVLQGHLGRVRAVTFSPDSRCIASGSEDETVRIWDAATGVQRHILRGHSSSVEAVTFSPDGYLIASGSDDRTVRIWDTVSGAGRHVLRNQRSWIDAVAVSLDSRFIVTGSNDGTLRLWDAATGIGKHVFQGHSGRVRAVAFSPDGRFIVSGSNDKTIWTWDRATGVKQRSFRGHSAWVRAVAFSPDGRFVVSGSDDTTVRIWDSTASIDQPAEQRVLQGHSDSVSAVAYSPDGRSVVSGSDDKTVRIWDSATGIECHSERRQFPGHADSVWAVAFSSDGHRIALGFDDKTVRIWDAATGAEQQVFRIGTVLRFLSFSSCGQHLVTDRGLLVLSPSCQCSHRIFATGSWITSNGEDLFYLHPDYQGLFGFVSGSKVIYTGSASQVLEFNE